jgi:hypothetical protein
LNEHSAYEPLNGKEVFYFFRRGEGKPRKKPVIEGEAKGGFSATG